MTDPKMWDLDIGRKVPEMTWWWWWWIFFIPDKRDPNKSRQLMILWSTKNADAVKVNDHWWTRKKPVERGADGKLGVFDGMTAAWWYDGEKMVEPLVLEEMDFHTEDGEGGGRLVPHGPNDYTFSGNAKRYQVNIKNEKYDFEFVMTPWKHLSKPIFRDDKYVKNYGYMIYRVYGMQMEGHVGKEQVKGTAYFQKVMVNSPALPWLWAVVHSENAHYIDYMMPHIGTTMLKRTDAIPTALDWFNFRIGRRALYIDGDTGEEHKFKRSSIKWAYDRSGLPTFRIDARNRKREHLQFDLKCYSRAYWRFEQEFWGRRNNVFYYNEFPASLASFDFTAPGKHVKRDDLGYVNANCEHSWGWLW